MYPVGGEDIRHLRARVTGVRELQPQVIVLPAEPAVLNELG